MNKTSIEWVKNPDGSQGYTWNPITGCLNGCSYCYARKLANTRLKERYLFNRHFPNSLRDNATRACRNDPFYPRFWPEKLKELPDWRAWSFVSSPERNKILRSDRRKSRGIFCCDMSDLFGIGVPKDWTRQVIDAIKGDEKDRFYLLTKQPQNLAKFSPFPDNCWVGVSATDDSMAWAAMVYLEKIEAKIKYISFEPLLANPNKPDKWPSQLDYIGRVVRNIQWVIIGAQTKPYNPPKIQWVKEIVEAADKAGVRVFLKDNLRTLINYQEHWMHPYLFEWKVRNGEKYGHWGLRQELPL